MTAEPSGLAGNRCSAPRPELGPFPPPSALSSDLSHKQAPVLLTRRKSHKDLPNLVSITREKSLRQLFLTVWGKVAFFSPSCPAFSSGGCLYPWHRGTMVGWDTPRRHRATPSHH